MCLLEINKIMSCGECEMFSGVEKKIPDCPLESAIVECRNCSSPHFSIDNAGPRRGSGKAPGKCDDCGHTVGKILKKDDILLC